MYYMLITPEESTPPLAPRVRRPRDPPPVQDNGMFMHMMRSNLAKGEQSRRNLGVISAPSPSVFSAPPQRHLGIGTHDTITTDLPVWLYISATVYSPKHGLIFGIGSDSRNWPSYSGSNNGAKANEGPFDPPPPNHSRLYTIDPKTGKHKRVCSCASGA